jgi:hypothetical protein
MKRPDGVRRVSPHADPFRVSIAAAALCSRDRVVD